MILPPVETTSSGARSMASTSAASQPGSGSASLFRKTTLRAVQRASAAARPPVKPRLLPSGRRRTSGKRCLIAPMLPSVEPLSTTVIPVPATSPSCFDTAATQARVSSRLFQLTMMTSATLLRARLRCGA